MKQTVYLSDFRDAFNRMDRGNQFSYEGMAMLLDWFEQYEQDTGEEIELDVIAICCEYTESHYTDIIGDYQTDICDHVGEYATEEESIEYIRNWLNDNTMLIGEPSEGVFLFQQF